MSMLASRLLKDGAVSVIVCASHAWLDASSMNNIDLSPISQLIVTDSIPLPESYTSQKIFQISIAPLLAKIISSDFSYISTFEFNPDTNDDQFVPE
jgi:ribose-phosphate pyrophosphokinase